MYPFVRGSSVEEVESGAGFSGSLEEEGAREVMVMMVRLFDT